MVSEFKLGHFTLKDNYLYRLEDFEECVVIDAFNIEFCEQPTFTVDSALVDQMGGTCFHFQVAKEGGKRAVQFATADKEEYMAWQQALCCYMVGSGIHSYYQLEDLLGQGSFGIVYLAKPCNDSVRTMGNIGPHSKVAIKQINKHKIRSSGQGLQAVVNEIRVHWTLHMCENILKLYQIFESPSNIYLILEF